MKNTRKYFFSYLLVVIFVFSLAFLFFFFKSGHDLIISLEVTLYGFVFSSIFFLIPMIVLFFNYMGYNRNSILEIREHVFYYQDKRQNIRYHLTDIKEVVVYMHANRLEKAFTIFFWHQYFYSKILLKDGTIIYVTCLLNDELELIIPHRLIRRVKKWIPVIVPHEKEIELDKQREIRLQKRASAKRNASGVLISNYKDKFKDKTLLELENMVANSKFYQPDAVEAAKSLLKERSDMN